ncbi:uncharacterized protein LOC121368014 [Gigantopelta aegis]|uniref:uncharacterized protein LOC121368014 n=1 Tax=Gigantopelta aegis TaxID=1735272 RepID=UPI001B88DA5E|nr:uncharacterized protein LOC121368014 [Gigantopelta aegis]
MMAASGSLQPVDDVVIAYAPADIHFVRRLADTIRSSKLSVWYSSPSTDPAVVGQQKSQAILGCKIFVAVLSDSSAEDKQLNDELALAYISNSGIFPIGLSSFRDLSKKLGGGTQLMLAKINWTFVFKEGHFEENMPALINCIKQEMERREASDQEFIPGAFHTHGMNFQMNFTHCLNLESDDCCADESVNELTKDLSAKGLSYDFWDRHFKGKSEVSFTDFRDAFLKDYGKKLVKAYSEDKKKLFVNLMYKDIFNLNKVVTRAGYDKVISNNRLADPHCFYHHLEEYAIAYLSLREVIDMDSTLRITTIQSLGKFTFPAIVSGLTEMLKDDDPNIRAVAAIALSKAGKDRRDTVDKLVSLLEDEDRLVRESALLSLGSLKATRAVSHVVDRWRNDPIKNVREAAELALNRMNTEDAKRCIHITEVLSSEMSALRPK